MRSGPLIVGKIVVQRSSQRSLVPHDHMIKALASDGSTRVRKLEATKAKTATKREFIVVASMISRMVGTSVFSDRTEFSVATALRKRRITDFATGHSQIQPASHPEEAETGTGWTQHLSALPHHCYGDSRSSPGATAHLVGTCQNARVGTL